MNLGRMHLQSVYRMILVLSFVVVAFNVYSYRIAKREVMAKSSETGSDAVVNTDKKTLVRKHIVSVLSARHYSRVSSSSSTKLPDTVSKRLEFEGKTTHSTKTSRLAISNLAMATRSKAKSTFSPNVEKTKTEEAKEIQRESKKNSTVAVISSEKHKKYSKQNSRAVTNSSKLHSDKNSEEDRGSIDEYHNMGGIGPSNESGSVVVNPHPFNFTISPADECDNGSGEVFLMIFIHTRPENIKHRHLIRSTWGKVDAYSVTVRRIFVMGLSMAAKVQDAIEMESSIYQDLLQEDFVDSYQNLTYKALGALKWVASHCSGARFVMKADDDAFINMPLLIQTLQQLLVKEARPSKTLYCNAWYGSDVPRYGKWAVSLKQRRYHLWPTFCQGLAYLMTPDLPGVLFNASFDLPFLWMDDVYVTGFLAKRVGVHYHTFTPFFVQEARLRKKLESPDHWKKVIFSHVHNFDMAKWAWSRAKRLFDTLSPNATAKTRAKWVAF